MKATLLSLLLFVLSPVIHAQNYKRVKIGLFSGYVTTADCGIGIFEDLEPAYRINDAIAISFRTEIAAIYRTMEPRNLTFQANASVNGIYYFSNSVFRPYAGLGLGLFFVTLPLSTVYNLESKPYSNIGCYPRLGFDFGHFNLNIDYNIIPDSIVHYKDGRNEETVTLKNSSLCIGIGFFLFGGRKSK